MKPWPLLDAPHPNYNKAKDGTVETPENGPLGQRMGHLFPSKLACHTLPFWQHLQAAQAGGPFFVHITWATISLYFQDDPGLRMIKPWLRIFFEIKSTLWQNFLSSGSIFKLQCKNAFFLENCKFKGFDGFECQFSLLLVISALCFHN